MTNIPNQVTHYLILRRNSLQTEKFISSTMIEVLSCKSTAEDNAVSKQLEREGKRPLKGTTIIQQRVEASSTKDFMRQMSYERSLPFYTRILCLCRVIPRQRKGTPLIWARATRCFLSGIWIAKQIRRRRKLEANSIPADQRLLADFRKDERRRKKRKRRNGVKSTAVKIRRASPNPTKNL